MQIGMNADVCILVTGIHEKQVTLDHEIETRIGNLKSDYAAIVVKALKWLNTRYPNDIEAVWWLNEILRGLQTEKLVLSSDKGPLKDQLQERWSFTNPAALQRLVRETHETRLNQEMDKYIDDFKEVRSMIPISDQHLQRELIFEPFRPDKPCLILVLERITYFGDIDVFLKEVFDIHARFFRIHKIEPGCVKVTLQFDASVESHIQACIDKKHEAVRHYAKMCIESQAVTPTTLKLDTTPEERKVDKSTMEKLKRYSGEILKALKL